MKTRGDFVTNSSSSSFILGFKGEEDIQSIATELSRYLYEWQVDSVVEDIKNGITSKEAAVELNKDWMWTYDWVFKGKTYWDLDWDVIKSEEYDNFIQECKNKLSDELMKELDEYDVISIVGYEDHSDFGRQMEYDIMPYLNCTIKRISHH